MHKRLTIAGILALVALAATDIEASELILAPTEAHAGSAAVYRASGGDICPTATTWLDPATNDLWIDCGADRGVYVWEAHTGDLYAYQGWGDALVNRPDIE